MLPLGNSEKRPLTPPVPPQNCKQRRALRTALHGAKQQRDETQLAIPPPMVLETPPANPPRIRKRSASEHGPLPQDFFSPPKTQKTLTLTSPFPTIPLSDEYPLDNSRMVPTGDPDIIAAIRQRETPLSALELSSTSATLQRGISHPTEIVREQFSFAMTAGTLQCLQPGRWLSDEVVNFYMLLLQDRARWICTSSLTHIPPSHYFNSFFMCKLREGDTYSYARVRKWSKRISTFNLNKIYMPIFREAERHWGMLVVLVQNREIHYHDSMAKDGTQYTQAALRWLADEAHVRRHGDFDATRWSTHESGTSGPQQHNGYDCGVYSILCADFLTDELPLAYHHSNMGMARLKIAGAIIRGHLTHGGTRIDSSRPYPNPRPAGANPIPTTALNLPCTQAPPS